MELRHLRYFSTLADELHFGRAAQKLFIAQPPLSRQIKILEDELGVQLFTRDSRKVKLTGYGEYLKKESERIFADVNGIVNNLKVLKTGKAGTVTIGYVGAVMHSFLPMVLSRIVKEYPGINTMLNELDNESQMKELRNRSIDIGFLRTPVRDDDIVLEQVYSETLSVIISDSHPLAGKKKIMLGDLAEEPFVAFTTRCSPGLRNSIISVCNRAGFMPRITHETSQINTILRLVECNLGYSIIPTSVKMGYNLNLRFIELNKFPERSEVYLANNPDNDNPVIRNIVNVVHSFPFKEYMGN